MEESPGAAEGERDHVQEALESMMSKKSLVKDQFLAGNMNPQMFIPIVTLLAHEKLKCVGATVASVIAAATRSTKLGIDEQQTMVRPVLKSKRNVVILREVPEGITEPDILELFVGAPHADRIVHVKPDVNNTWFVKFNLDDGTQDVVLWLRTQKLKGLPVNAAIKSEHFLRSFYPLHPPAQGQPPMCFSPADQMGDQRPPLELLGGGMPMQMQMPMAMQMPPAPPPLQEGMQLAGYWKPWGQRYQAPALRFTSPTTLAAESIPEPIPQEPPLEFLDELNAADGGGGGKGWKGGKDKTSSDWKGGKGKWRSGKEWGGKDSGSKGWYGGGSDSYASGKASGQDWYAGGGEGYSGGKGRKGGWSSGGFGGGKALYGGLGEADAGDEGYIGYGGKDWYAASSGKGGGERWVPAAQRKGGNGDKGFDAGAGLAEGGKRGAAAGRSQQKGGSAVAAGVVGISEAPSSNKFGAMGSVYQHDVRKYSRQDFERIRQVVNKENLTRPEALVEALGGDLPVLLEAAVLEPIKT